jgi:hypothetical protein
MGLTFVAVLLLLVVFAVVSHLLQTQTQTQTQSFAVQHSPAGWRGPIPIIPKTNRVSLDSISCASSELCAAIGSEYDPGGRDDGESYYAIVDHGGTWSAPVTLSTHAESPPQGEYISCPTTIFCGAIVGSSNYYIGDLVTYDGATWSSPVYVGDIGGSGSALTAISCTSSAFCMAVGGDDAYSIYDGSSWTAPGTVAGTGGESNLTALACTSPSFCVTTNYDRQAFTYNGTTWQSTALLPQLAEDNAVADITCTSPAYCVAVGNGIYTYNGSTWAVVYPANVDYTVTSVSCPSQSFCIAVDNQGHVIELTDGVWVSQGDTTPNQDDAIFGVSCPAASFCVAVGQDGVGWYFKGP